MQTNELVNARPLSKDILEVLIRVGIIGFLVFMCIRIFAPFMGLMLWALIMAIALYPLNLRLTNLLGGRQRGAATVLVLAALLLIGLPTVLLGSSFAGRVYETYSALRNNEIVIERPDPSVADWPLIGDRIHAAWNSAAEDLPAFLEGLQPQLGNFSKYMLSVAANTAGVVFVFLGSIIIAGIMMAYGESGSRAMLRIISRVAGPGEGARLQNLAIAAVRSVATGVIGVAFIQALLLGIGFLLADVPGAGLLALVVAFIALLQLPAALVTLPVIAYLWWWGDGSTTINIVFTVYLVVAGLMDNVLKPILLGRGVDVPMPVILLGALGGMASAGIMGLFLGAVMLAVGYQILMGWVNDETSTKESAEIGIGGAPSDSSR